MNFALTLIRWFEKYKRDLPWRNTQNPYYIWLSEIILQQTRVYQGLPYYEKFVTTFPTLEDLAQAEEQEVLRLWQGLGYYSRARNMHHTARFIVQELGGKFPNTFAELIKLKGIGHYTAAAIASFAFQERVAVLDGNVYRVLSRFLGIETDISSAQAPKIFQETAQSLLPEEASHVYNQAIMEFGALHCTPAQPQCFLCPLNTHCIAFQQGKQAVLPVKSPKVKVKDRYLNYLVLSFEEKFALSQRQKKDIWQGLYDFCLVETSQAVEDIATLALPPIALNAIWERSSPLIRHLLTHQRLWIRFWHGQLSTLPTDLGSFAFYSPSEIEALPKPIVIDHYWQTYVKLS